MLTALLLAAATAASGQTGLEDALDAALLSARAAASRPDVVVDPKARGSWFRKVSSPDSSSFDGITGWGTLPRPAFDLDRQHAPAPGEGAYTAGPLDNPGVYLGAHAAVTEIDAGLKWDHRYGPDGRDTGEYAWRVFWRVASPAGKVWANPKPGSAQDVYLEPGQRFAMTLRVRPDGTARLDVRGAAGGPGTHAVFPAGGFWDGARPLPRRFKRVHAIDQFATQADGRRAGLEGRAAAPTRAALDGGRWDGTALLGQKRRPLSGALAVEWRGPDEESGYGRVFPAAVVDGKGGEDITVTPPQP
ncbi:MAG TPA: hypothetical protein VN915_15275 [Elusimicrobiota bacterium]|nr:hypothetical protein [Elusimicrobiota bacterium]